MKWLTKNSLIAVVLLILLNSCVDKNERQINKHFKKFILINKLKDFEIESIKPKILTVTQNQINKINAEIQENRNVIVSYSNSIINTKNELLEIKNGKAWTYEGRPYYSFKNPIEVYGRTSFDYAKGELWDPDRLGRQKLIDKKNILIQNKYLNIPILEKDIEKLEIEKENIKKKPNKSILETNSVVTIKGVRASGTSRVTYYVSQYPDSEIKSVRQF